MSNWKELSGEKNWSGLLRPLKKSLGQTLIHYGKRIDAIYDTVEQSVISPRYGQPKYEENEFFSKVGLGLYTMNNYVYGDSKVDFFAKGSRAWIGYVAVATDEGKRQLGRRDILICFRGSVTIGDWVKDFQFGQTSAAPILGQYTGNARVHGGFFSIYMSARNQVLDAVKKLVNQYQHEEISITITGHGIGSSFAILNAADIVANGYNSKCDSSCMPKVMVTVFAFASPKVGNSDFVKVFEKFSNLHLLHTRHFLDIVPELPPTTNFSKMGTLLRITYTNFPIWDLLSRRIILKIAEILTRFHLLKNLLVAVEKQQERKGLLFAAAPNVAVFGAPQLAGLQGANFVAAPRGAPQLAGLQGANFVAAPHGAPQLAGLQGANFVAAPHGALQLAGLHGAKFADDDIVILDDEIDESNVVMEKLANGNYELYLRTPQLQTA